MDRTAWIAVILCVAGIVGWEVHLASKHRAELLANPPAAETSPAPGDSNAPAPPASPALTSGKPEPVVDLQAPIPPAVKATEANVPEAIVTLSGPSVEYRFTNLGGGISEAVLLGPKNMAENGEHIILNRAGYTPIGAIGATGGDGSRLPYEMRKEDDKTVVFTRVEPNGLKIEKRFTVDLSAGEKQIPTVLLDVAFTNTGTQPFKSPYFVHAGSNGPIHRRDLPMNTAFDWYTDGRYHTEHGPAFDAGHIPFVGIQTKPAREVITEPVTKAAWVAVKNQFYATILTPLPPKDNPDQEPPATEIWARRFDVPLNAQDTAAGLPPLHAIDAALGLPVLDLAPGASFKQSFQVYAGPKLYKRLAALGHEEQDVMDFGKFKLVSITLLDLMNLFKSWLHNYGLAIILLTFLVKLVLFPLQQRANKSMKRMSALSPKMTEIREKYKDDPARAQQETMKLYKEYGVSPVGGCWPMLIQMPIFFGFLYMLGTAAELRNSSFLWVRDLSQPDTVAHLFGLPINVLPLLMIGTQFWQMSLTPKTGDAQQQKVFMFMPLIFGFFCYSFAAALALYYTMQGLLTIVQLYFTRNQPIPQLSKVTAAPMAGKRGGNLPLDGGGKKGGSNGRNGGGNNRVRI